MLLKGLERRFCLVRLLSLTVFCHLSFYYHLRLLGQEKLSSSVTDTSAAISFQQILTPGTFFLFPCGSCSNNHTLDTKLYLGIWLVSVFYLL